MSEKLYVKYENNLLGYWIIMSQNPLIENKALLGILFDALTTFNDWIFIDKGEKSVFITQHFFGDAEDEDVVLELSNENYNYIFQQWNKVVEQRPKYFVLSRNDNGWIDLELKNELSNDDQKYLDQDKIKKL